jgi:hypothetical protein
MEKANLLEDLSNILSDEGEQDIAVVLVKCTILKFFGTLGQNQVNKYKKQ